MNTLATAVPAKYKYNTMIQQSIGASSTQITQPQSSDEVGLMPLDNIFVQAPTTNTGKITLRNKSPVTDGGAGVELAPGANYNLPDKNPANWYIIASAASQKFNIVYSRVVE